MRVTGAAAANALVANPILLFREGEGDEGGCEQVRFGTLESVQRAGANPELNVLHTKSRAGAIGWRGAEVFARTEEKIHTQRKGLSGGLSRGSIFELGKSPYLGHNGHRERLDATRGSVDLAPSPIQRCQTNVELAVPV